MHSTSKSQERFNAVEVHAHCLSDISDEANSCAAEQFPDVLERWGDCVANHFILEHMTLECHSNDALPVALSSRIEKNIVTFFDAVTSQLNQVPWFTAANGRMYNAGVNALLKVTDALSNSSTQSITMDNVLTVWSPEALWHALKVTQDDQYRVQQDTGSQWAGLLFWRWTKVLGLQAVVSNWQPKQNSFSDGLWYVTPFCTAPDPDAAVATMVEKMPWSFGAAMEFYRHEDDNNITENMIESIFSMDLSKADTVLSARVLLELVFDYTRYGHYTPAMEYFQKKHSTMFLAFQLHAVLCGDILNLEQHVSTCIDTWRKVVDEKAIEQIPLPDLGFERP